MALACVVGAKRGGGWRGELGTVENARKSQITLGDLTKVLT